MSSQRPTPKPSKPPNQSQTQTSNPPSARSSTSTSSLSSHLAMVELKQRILTSISKLSDRDTHQIAVEDLEKTIQSLPGDAIPMLLNCLYEASADPKPAVKKESLRLLSVACSAHADAAAAHLPKILAQIVRRLKDSPESGVRDACRDAVGALAAQYLRGESNAAAAASGLFMKPLFEAMAEQNKGVQAGAAMCVARVVESAADPPVPSFQKLCPRICKLLNSPNFLAKASLLPVVSSLSQGGAIAPQSLDNLLQSIHDCLGNPDWATRKAAAEALIALATHSRHLIAENTNHTLTVLEACRLDKIKPVRDCMTEALQLWKNVAGKGDGASEDQQGSANENCQPADASEKDELKNQKPLLKDSSNKSPTSDTANKAKGGSIPDKAVVILKKKPHVLTDKELNPEFFQNLETRGSGELPVEVVVPRRNLNSPNSNNEEEPEKNNSDSKGRPNRFGNVQSDDPQGAIGGSKFRNLPRDKWPEERANGKDTRLRPSDVDDKNDLNQRELSGNRAGFSKSNGQSEGSFINNKGNWLAIQRQLLQLERQQAHLMNMLQDFMGGSHDSMITLENRVRGLERVVEDMARDLSISSGRRGGNFGMGFDGPNRPLGKYNGFPDYSSSKFGRGVGDGRIPLGERYAQTDGIASGMRGRGPPWRSDMPEAWDFPSYGAPRNNQMGSRRALDRSPKAEHESDPISTRRGWDKGAGPARLGEGPSARSVWQASKDEATLEAIRVAGEDNGGPRAARAAIPEMTAEAMGDDNAGPERDPVWTAWTNAMDALHAGDMDTAYAEVLSTGDDVLLVKLMDRSGPVIDLLSDQVANEALNAVAQFLTEQSLFDICLSWVQQLAELVLEHGPDILGIPMEMKRELIVNLHEASLATDPPEDWEGATPDQIVMQLASSWEIDLQQNDK